MTSYGKGRSLCLKVCLLIKISWFKKYLVPCITLHIRSIDFLPFFFLVTLLLNGASFHRIGFDSIFCVMSEVLLQQI